MNGSNKTIVIEKSKIVQLATSKVRFKTKLTLEHIKPKKRFFGLFETSEKVLIKDTFGNEFEDVDDVKKFFDSTYNHLYCYSTAFLDDNSVYYCATLKVEMDNGNSYTKYFNNDNEMMKNYKKILSVLNDSTNLDKFVEI